MKLDQAPSHFLAGHGLESILCPRILSSESYTVVGTVALWLGHSYYLLLAFLECTSAPPAPVSAIHIVDVLDNALPVEKGLFRLRMMAFHSFGTN